MRLLRPAFLHISLAALLLSTLAEYSSACVIFCLICTSRRGDHGAGLDPGGSHGVTLLGLPNRLFVACAGSAFCVLVEFFLNAADALTWDWAWWNRGAPWLIFLIGYLPFFLVAFWVHDMGSRRRQLTVLGVIYAFNALCLLVFGGVLGWI